jgi:hypothetical protein
MIGYQPQAVILRKDRGLVMKRPVFEVKDRFRCDLGSLGDLDQISGGEHLPIQRFEDQKPMGNSFLVMKGNIL